VSWDEGKNAHLKLSGVAAASYKGYAICNAATRAYMRFEESTIASESVALARRVRALDLGCGEGRISFVLAKYFTEVVGFDMSPEMILTADDERLKNAHGNVRFIVGDLENELLSRIDSSSVDLVAASFGMGSFVAEPEMLLRDVLRVLRPGGVFITSYYNTNSLSNMLTLPEGWEPSLAARVDGYSRHGLVVTFGGEEFDISARSYTPDEIYHLMVADFQKLRILTYPSISAVLPSAVTSQPGAMAICEQVDSVLAETTDLGVGAYIVAIAQKFGDCEEETDLKGYARLLRLLQIHNIAPRVVEHSPLTTMADAERELGELRPHALKSVLFRIMSRRADLTCFVLCVTEAGSRVDSDKLASLLDVETSHVELASRTECENATGFKVGALTPIGMPKDVPVIFDRALANFAPATIVWCGSGKRTESFAMPIADLITLAGPSFRDIV
jgi:ubiquinone/menaquinone biosynthesis C-methylase UbiE/prolyl-tRNA editing enzyme YbaK/EbsC (Cys-tRNA(Pro) deacylase)